MKEIIENMKNSFNVETLKLPAILSYEFLEGYQDGDSIFLPIEVKLNYPENNFLQSHKMQLMCPDLDDATTFGIDYCTSDGDIGEITAANIMTSLYFDLAFS